MAELHPFFVHFPVALIMVASIFDVYGAARMESKGRETAYILQIIAGLFSILAALSGNNAETVVRSKVALAENVVDALNSHISMGNALVWIIVFFVVGRTFAILEKKPWANQGWLFPLLSLGLAVAVLITGLLGGALSRDILQYFVNH